MRWRFFSKPKGLDLERCCAAGEGNNRVLLSFFIFTLNLKYRIMENPFGIIVEKITAIEMRLETIERLLNYTDEKLHYSEIMSLKQLCNYCDFTKSFVYKQTSTREIPHYKKGKRLFFKRTEIDEWLLKNKVKTMDDLQREATLYSIRRRR